MEASTIMALVAIILLAFHWKGPNAVWGGATLGLVVGIIVALITGDWSWLAIIFAIATFVGVLFEWIGRLSQRAAKR